MRRARQLIPALTVLLIAAGCSNTTDDDAVADATSSGAASTTNPAPTPWDPCTIPNEAIERAGLNVDTKESGVFGRDQNGFKICGWESRPPSSKYYVRIFVGFETMDFVNDPSYFNRLEPVRVGTRDATQYQQLTADAGLNCGVAFVSGNELIRATIITGAGVGDPPYDPCTELNKVVAALDSELPT
ncbi:MULTISPECIES: DUF3558 domain-containing protein [unclassified Rhodococcus (in: high G+C Gram-positive bacteria)]|uniref:DUF3558 domain-containing protein n=1 Tax=unclassified Rhodococcus (in: high G+C Gram-positive bacteria) TaxID=192944 RepID=UPI00211AFBCB|nr:MULTISPECIES: DUF3558 domain-containing protein [unclassified Rhodococcus (in: high G+C Gram-positive bacteria)]